eukprot:TRINITY_DN1592_c0_g1_i3.p1 TRINITY_DN1592_c0_g1~~TRINITY_DN1592_c0_g1_i3.p1  ORF type:complete len:155 (-),score=36.50 TRINITY_DN1592_c0_g1_i3:330-794(-)
MYSPQNDYQLSLMEDMIDNALLSRTHSLLTHYTQTLMEKQQARESFVQQKMASFETESEAFLKTQEGHISGTVDFGLNQEGGGLEGSLLQLKLISREVSKLQQEWDENFGYINKQASSINAQKEDMWKRIETQLKQDPALYLELKNRLLRGNPL